jgi:hypothetical protein
MTHNEFNQLRHTIAALPPEQMRQLRDELDRKLSALANPPATAPTHKPIWEVFQELSASVPDEVWDALPTDLAEQHDHYIYGTPKRPTA